MNEDDIVKYAQQEMKSVNTILNSIEPYYKEKIEQEFTEYESDELDNIN